MRATSLTRTGPDTRRRPVNRRPPNRRPESHRRWTEQRGSHTPYGSTLNHAGASSPLQYNGEYHDPTGLYYLRARYYDPATARFLTRDPLESITSAVYNYADGDPSNVSDPSGMTAYPVNDNARRAFTFFRRHGLSRVAAAALVGNFMYESGPPCAPGGVDPTCKEGNNGVGRGIAQWTVDDRWKGVEALARKKHVEPTTLHVQLLYVWQELNSPQYRDVLEVLQNAGPGDLKHATYYVRRWYERGLASPTRLENARAILKACAP